jgi:hypothetical protein
VSKLCPSAQPGMDRAIVLGVVQRDGPGPILEYLNARLAATPEVLATAAPLKPTEVFRLAATCAEHKCPTLTAQIVDWLPGSRKCCLLWWTACRRASSGRNAGGIRRRAARHACAVRRSRLSVTTCQPKRVRCPDSRSWRTGSNLPMYLGTPRYPRASARPLWGDATWMAGSSPATTGIRRDDPEICDRPVVRPLVSRCSGF